MATAFLAIATAALTSALTWAYFLGMRARKHLEPPSARGMHRIPVATGAGAVIIAVTIGIWAMWSAPGLTGGHAVLLAAAASLAAMSWIDDRRGGLPPVVRLLGHTLAVALLLLSLGAEQRLLPAIPAVAERVLLGLAWVWFINLFNFMDGIDGLAGTETIAVAGGYVLIASVSPLEEPMANLGLVIAAAAAGYLVWNWHPAKVMMGDTGSIALGFLLGWLLIDLVLRGHAAAAAILPLSFVADATLTLVRRVLRGEKPWQPHREHAYQRAALAMGSHAPVVVRIGAANALLIALAVLSKHFPLAALAGAFAVVAILIGHLEQVARQPIE
jgi:UDP-N-acetylmuramyl pentapeptide phosphotransferase/UDP-N-acetylglucosamine-1-phosphate transferase